VINASGFTPQHDPDASMVGEHLLAGEKKLSLAAPKRGPQMRKSASVKSR